MRVPLQITFRNLGPSDAVRSKLREKADWLEKFSDQIISCHIVVEKPHKHHLRGNLYQVRINLRLPGAELVINRAPDSHLAHKDAYVTIRDAFDEARREVEEYTRRRRREIKVREAPPQGYVARLIYGDGQYGFIRTEDGRELYFHSNTVLHGQFDQLEVGAKVRFAEEMGDEGPQASTVEFIGK